MAIRKRNIVLRVPVTAEERAMIEQKMRQMGTGCFSVYARKMLIDGYVIKIDYSSNDFSDHIDANFLQYYLNYLKKIRFYCLHKFTSPQNEFLTKIHLQNLIKIFAFLKRKKSGSA